MSAGVSYSLEVDNRQMLAALQSARGAFKGFTGFVAKAGIATVKVNVEGALKSIASVRSAMANLGSSGLGKIASFAALIAGFASLGGAALLFKDAIGEAANMEGLKTSFEVLLGSADAATERMGTLSKMAADTPFELGEIAQASRMLQVLTQGTLATGAGLTMIGDVASGVQQPLQEVAMWVGRLYDSLKNGQPIGEPIARLQEMGAVSGATRRKLEALQESGGSFKDMWKAVGGEFMKFSGMMVKASGTWDGLMSTLSDGIKEIKRAFGEPMLDALKPFLTEAIAMAASMVPSARASGSTVADAVKEMRALFEAGELGETAGLSLKVAFTTEATG